MSVIKRYNNLLAFSLFFVTVLVFITAFNQPTKQHSSIAQRIQQSDQTIIWGVKNDTNLFGFYNLATQQIEGFDVDIARELTKRLTGDENNAYFVEVTSKTRIPLLKNNNIDAIIATMTITEERKKMVDYTDVYFAAGQSLLVPDDSPITSVESLTSEQTVITVKGSTSAKNIRTVAPQVTIIELENYAEAFTALQAKQGDAITTDNAILMGLMTDTPGYKLAGENFTDEPYGIAVNKNQEEFLLLLNHALAQMRADGTYDRIYHKWFHAFTTKEVAE